MLVCLVAGLLSRPIIFFFNDTATTEIYTLSLHDALPISPVSATDPPSGKISYSSASKSVSGTSILSQILRDRKSTRLNSSHLVISYAVFCLKKKKDSPPIPLACPHSPDNASCTIRVMPEH